MGLCQDCESAIANIFRDGVPQDIKRVYKHSAESLIKAAGTSCYLCANLWSRMEDEDKAFLHSSSSNGLELSATEFDGPTNIQLMFTDPYDRGWPRMMMGCFRLFKSDRPITLTLTPSTNDTACWDTINRWLQNCQCNHDNCRAIALRSGGSWLPTRLVDVGHHDDNSGSVRVVESSDLADRDRATFLALSHCWGLRRFLVMTAHNRSRFESGIPASELNPNFQDAIHATRGLGFRYIWIDSLCILQGSREDWAKEAPLMNLVYTYAVLTLAAAASSDGFGGLFRERNPDLAKPHRLQARSGEAGPEEWFLSRQQDPWEEQIEGCPLNKRAWVVQERLLAPRTVFFGAAEILWECHALEASETFPGGFPWQIRDEFTGFKNLGPNPVDVAEPKQGDTAPLYYPWTAAVSQYSRCALTQGSDKLIAIAGIAKEFGKSIDDEYVAGLWRKDLINELRWSGGDKRATPYRAPTWSWASVDGAVAFRSAEKTPVVDVWVEISEVDIEADDEDGTIGVRDGSIRGIGWLIDLPRAEVPVHGMTGQAVLMRSASFDPGIIHTDVMNNPSERAYFLPLGTDTNALLDGLIVREVLHLRGSNMTEQAVLLERIGSFHIERGYQLAELGQNTVRQDITKTWFDSSAERVNFVLR